MEIICQGDIQQAKMSDFVRVTRLNFHDMQRFINGIFVTYASPKYATRDDYMEIDEINELCKNNANLQDIETYMKTHSIHVIEIYTLEKWGLVNINGKEYIMILNGKPYANMNEGIRISKGNKGMRKRNQGTWEAISECPHCGADMHYSMTISDGTRGRGRITVTDQEGQPIDTTIQSIGLYYCPQCMKFVALNDMLHV